VMEAIERQVVQWPLHPGGAGISVF
jgi:hypothetical protein